MRVKTPTRTCAATSAVVLAITAIAGTSRFAQPVQHERGAEAAERADRSAESVEAVAQESAEPAPSNVDSTTFERYMRERERGEPLEAATLDLDSQSPFSLQLNLDLTNQYFFHGIIQESTGLILQPSAELTIHLLKHDDLAIDGVLNVWNSVHGERTGVTDSGTRDVIDYWYECDLSAGIVVTVGKVSLSTFYTYFTSPSNAFDTVEELDITLEYDDSDLLGALALHPYVMLGIETSAGGSDGADTDRGMYLELGIAPGFTWDLGKTPVAISFPASIGFSLDDYYQDASGEDDAFGFAQVGVAASLPLPFGDRYGAWSLNAGAAALYLGDHTAEYNDGEDLEFIGSIGLQVNF